MPIRYVGHERIKNPPPELNGGGRRNYTYHCGVASLRIYQTCLRYAGVSSLPPSSHIGTEEPPRAPRAICGDRVLAPFSGVKGDNQRDLVSLYWTSRNTFS